MDLNDSLFVVAMTAFIIMTLALGFSDVTHHLEESKI